LAEFASTERDEPHWYGMRIYPVEPAPLTTQIAIEGARLRPRVTR
jgi:hypothetical protein